MDYGPRKVEMFADLNILFLSRSSQRNQFLPILLFVYLGFDLTEIPGSREKRGENKVVI